MTGSVGCDRPHGSSSAQENPPLWTCAGHGKILSDDTLAKAHPYAVRDAVTATIGVSVVKTNFIERGFVVEPASW